MSDRYIPRKGEREREREREKKKERKREREPKNIINDSQP